MMRLRNLSSCPSFTLLPAAKAVDRRTLQNALRERTANAFVKLFDSGLWFSYLSLAELDDQISINRYATGTIILNMRRSGKD